MHTGKLVHSIPETAKALSVSRSTIYRLIRDGELESLRVRQIQRVSQTAINRYLHLQQRRQREETVRN